MPYSMADALSIVLPHLVPLATPQTQADLYHLAANLAPIPWGGFECRLSATEAQVDLHQGIAADQGHISILLAHMSKNNEELGPAWARIRNFCAQWSDPASLLAAHITKLGLEFDMAAPACPTQPPSVFVQLERGLTPATGYAVARTALATLWGNGPTAALQANLERCFAACPGEAEIGHLGMMLSRQVEVVRVNVRQVAQRELATFLRDVGWPYPSVELEALFGELTRYVDRIIVCLDVGASIQPKIGLECAWDRQPAQNPRCAAFLEHLAERGLCAPAKVAPLLAWAGRCTPPASVEPWPGHLVAASLLQPTDRFSAIERYLSHCKIDYHPPLDDRSRHPLRAKGYLGFQHHWLQPTATGENRGEGKPEAESRTADLLHRFSNGVAEALNAATGAAVAFLLGARDQGGWWRDFPTLMGGSDEWVTAYTGVALAAISEQAHAAAQSAWNLLNKHHCFTEGWAYNVFHPHDSDATAWLLCLANALGLGRTPSALKARQFLDRHTLSDGGVVSYLDRDRPHLVKLLRPGSLAGFCAVHTCVTAAAAAADERSHQARDYVRNAQRLDGSWGGYWWQDDAYTTALAAKALACHGRAGDERRVRQAVQWATRRVGASGAVYSAAYEDDSAFATALCVQNMALADRDDHVRQVIAGAVRWLIAQQRPDGSWRASAQMRVPPPHAVDPEKHAEGTSVFLDERRIFTTATVLAALKMAKGYLEASEEP